MRSIIVLPLSPPLLRCTDSSEKLARRPACWVAAIAARTPQGDEGPEEWVALFFLEGGLVLVGSDCCASRSMLLFGIEEGSQGGSGLRRGLDEVPSNVL